MSEAVSLVLIGRKITTSFIGNVKPDMIPEIPVFPKQNELDYYQTASILMLCKNCSFSR